MRTLVIQAGGNSRRMGQNKALMPFCGEPLIERVLRRTSGLADEIFITTDLLGKLDYLGLPLITDILPGKGALGSLYTALATAANSEVIVVACDMPFVIPWLLLAECDLLSITQTETFIPLSEVQGREMVMANVDVYDPDFHAFINVNIL